MNRKEEWEKERHNVWDKAKNVGERINNLQKLAAKYPEYMTTLSDIAVSYLDAGDIDNTIKTYQKIIREKDTFELVWDNELGKAYLFTEDYKKAVETFERSNVISYDQELFLALSYLKNGDKKKSKKQFETWISEDLEKSFNAYNFKEYFKALLSEEEETFIQTLWNKYYEKYSSMEPYQLYCCLYKQHYLTSAADEDIFEDDDFELPPKLNRSKFEQLSSEYLYLDRKSMFSDMSDSDYDRFFELRDLLFADIMY